MLCTVQLMNLHVLFTNAYHSAELLQWILLHFDVCLVDFYIYLVDFCNMYNLYVISKIYFVNLIDLL